MNHSHPLLDITYIRQFRPRHSILSGEERTQLAGLTLTAAKEFGLGAALSALWEQQKAIGFILGEPSEGENLDDESRFLSKKIGPYWLVHNPARQDRRNVEFLVARGILKADPLLVYERLERGAYDHYPAKKHGFREICFFCSAEGSNPNEVLLSLELGGAEFIYGANYATLGHGHFTMWTKVPILQKYWPEDTLLWLAEHGRRLRSSEYTTFFNGLGAGNSIMHFHYQTLREIFPIMEAPVHSEFSPSGIARLEWPMPAYRTAVSPHANLPGALSPMDGLVQVWLSMDPSHSLNLVHACDSDGTAYIVFVPRIDSKGARRPAQIGNDFAACEVGGRINIEKREEWEWARAQPASAVADLLRSLAPPASQIARLQASL